MSDNETKNYLCHMLNVRLTDEENVRFHKLAERLQTTRSRLLRKMIREAIGAGPDMLPQEWKIFEDLVYQLAAVGRNLNQLVRAVHSGNVAMLLEDRALVEEVGDQIVQARKEVLAAIERSCNRWVR